MSEEALRSQSDSRPAPASGAPMNITGVGAVTGYGWGTKHMWDGFLLGESAVKLTELPYYADHDSDGTSLHSAYVATIAPGGDRSDGPSRFTRALRFAAREAITDARSRGWTPGPVVGVVHSLVLGDIEMWADFHRAKGARVRGRQWIKMMPSTVLTMMMKEHGFHGPTMGVSAMCASGNAGLITAKSWLDAGVCTDVILLATDLSLMDQDIRGFVDVGVAVGDQPPLDACRPFQEGSRGFVAGEAAVAMVLSKERRGSYGTMLGGSMTMDAYSAVSLDPGMTELFRAFEDAMRISGVDPADVAYLNAHGPGTAQCDAAEARVLDEMFPQARGIFSVKPLTGHCQAAAGAVELLATIYAFQTGYIPAPRRVAPGHPRLVSGHTPRVPGPMVKSSIGLGGFNAVVVIGEPED